jgi:NitT/TauT family transport system permease protein
MADGSTGGGSWLRSAAIGAGSLLAVVAVWQLVKWSLGIPKFLLPGPLDVLETMVDFGPAWAIHVWTTARATLLGFGLAIIVGLGLAVAIVHSRFLSQLLTPIIVVLQIVPKVAFAPLLLIWFGAGTLPIVAIAFLVAFFPMVVNSAVGMADVEPDLIDLTRVLRLSWWRVLFAVRLPNALPHIFSGLRVASTLAVIGTIIGEFVGSNVGLGYLILIANNQMNTPLAFASIIIVSLFGLMLYGLIAAIETVAMPWRVRPATGMGLTI